MTSKVPDDYDQLPEPIILHNQPRGMIILVI